MLAFDIPPEVIRSSLAALGVSTRSSTASDPGDLSTRSKLLCEEGVPFEKLLPSIARVLGVGPQDTVDLSSDLNGKCLRLFDEEGVRPLSIAASPRALSSLQQVAHIGVIIPAGFPMPGALAFLAWRYPRVGEACVLATPAGF